MTSTWHAIGCGAYEERRDGRATGRYRARPRIHHRLTWRALTATSAKAAQREAARKDWIAKADSFAELANHWARAGHPGRKGMPRSERMAKLSLPWLLKYFGKFRADEIRLKHLPDYAVWRKRQMRRASAGGRMIDLDLTTLSNILHYGVKLGVLEINYIYRARDKFSRSQRHAHQVMPESAEEIHRLAARFLEDRRSEVMAWLSFFSEFTGLRHSELLRLDLKSTQPHQPGYLHWFTKAEREARTDGLLGQLHLGQRSKNGVNPYADIGPEFAEMIRAFLNWHRTRFKPVPGDKHRWFFPGRMVDECLAPDSFGHALRRGTRELALHHITPHGFRAFFATKHLRDGKRPVEIAYDMGDRTVELVEHIYTGNVKGAKLWWVPADGLPAWQNWLPQSAPAAVPA